MERLAKADILCSPVNDVSVMVDHPQTLENGTMWDVEIPGQGTVRLAGNPVHLSRTPLANYQEPAAIGAQSDEVLSAFGYSDGEIKALRAAKAVQ
jgi:crotonobetainyl-CoA:carnitine CoA-transferase CaiB-like acyl-CoA transferase